MKERDARTALRTKFIDDILKRLDQVIAMANYAEEIDISEAATDAKLTAQKARSRPYETLPQFEKRSIEQMQRSKPKLRWYRSVHQ